MNCQGNCFLRKMNRIMKHFLLARSYQLTMITDTQQILLGTAHSETPWGEKLQQWVAFCNLIGQKQLVGEERLLVLCQRMLQFHGVGIGKNSPLIRVLSKCLGNTSQK